MSSGADPCGKICASPEPHALVVEDEENVAYVVALALRHSGFVVRVAGTGAGAGALRLNSGSPMPDIVVLDVMLPDLDGFEVCRRMRADRNDVPVLFLTAKDAPTDRLYGLTIGGDDYLTKPFGVDELVARVKVILRRVGRGPTTQLIRCDDLSLDDDAHIVMRGDQKASAVADGVQDASLFHAQRGDRVQNSDPGPRVALRLHRRVNGGREAHLSTLRKKLGARVLNKSTWEQE